MYVRLIDGVENFVVLLVVLKEGVNFGYVVNDFVWLVFGFVVILSEVYLKVI